MGSATDGGPPQAVCVTCGPLGTSKPEMIGVRFECPNAERFKPHVSYVVADEGIASWMRFEAFLVAYQTQYSPLRWIPLFAARNGKGRVGLYLLVRCGLLVAAVMGASLMRWSVAGTACLWSFSAAMAFDIIAAQTSGVFSSRWPAHPLRTVWLSFFGVFQFALCFAVFYATQAGAFNREIAPWEAVYFSVVTLATVGYGDISPCPHASLLQGIVVTEILVGLYFLSVLLGQIVAWVADRPPRPRRLDEVLATRQSPGAGGEQGAAPDERHMAR